MPDPASVMQEIETNRRQLAYKPDETAHLVSAKSLTPEEKIALLTLMTEGNIFPWLDYICKELRELATQETHFIELLEKIIEKVHTDLAQGPFIDTLTYLGKNNPELGMWIWTQLTSREKKDVAAHYAGIVLGGVGISSPELAVPLIKELVAPDIEKTLFGAAKVVAARIMLAEGTNGLAKEDYLKMLEKARSNLSSEPLRIQLLLLALDMHSKDRQAAMTALQTFTRSGQPSSVRYILADRLWLFELSDKEDEFELITKLTQNSEEREVLERVCYYLAKNNAHNKESALKVLLMLISKDTYGSALHYAFEEMGKSDFDYYYGALLTHITHSEKWQELIDLRSLIGSLAKQASGKQEAVTNLERAIADRLEHI